MKQQYRLLQKLETSELADQYQAEVRGSSSPRVVKLFHASTTDPAYAASLGESARVLRDVTHPGLLPWLEVGWVEKRLALVREDVGGINLGAALERLRGQELLLGHGAVIELVIDLLEALALSHAAGVVHGAITPGNVLCLPAESLAMTDFGALRALMSAPALHRAFLGRGRNAYRAPEVALGEAPTPRSDIFSVAALTYELLTLREAVGSGMSTRREAILPPSRVDRRINPRLDQIIMRGLEPTPQRRTSSCAEFSLALAQYLEKDVAPARPGERSRFFSALLASPRAEPKGDALPWTGTFSLELLGAGPQGRDEGPTVPIDSRWGINALSSSAVQPFPEDERTDEAIPPRSEEETTSPGAPPPAPLTWEAPPGAAPVGKTVQNLPETPKDARKRGVRTVQAGPWEAKEEEAKVPWSVSEQTPAKPMGVNLRRTLLEEPAVQPEPSPLPAFAPHPVPEVNDTEMMAISPPAVSRKRGALRWAGWFLVVAVPLSGALLFWRYAPKEVEHAGPNWALKPLATAPPSPAPMVEGEEESAYLSLSSNVPVKVFIDGVLTKKKAPLVRYRIQPGARRVEVESVSTRERRGWTLRFDPAQHRTHHETFRVAPKR